MKKPDLRPVLFCNVIELISVLTDPVREKVQEKNLFS